MWKQSLSSQLQVSWDVIWSNEYGGTVFRKAGAVPEQNWKWLLFYVTNPTYAVLDSSRQHQLDYLINI